MSSQHDNRDTQIKELTLLLMYLTSWEENPYAGPHGLTRKIKQQLTPEQLSETYHACWKSYDFDVLNKLTEEGLVNASGRRKTAYFTRDGEERAIALMKKYGIAKEDDSC